MFISGWVWRLLKMRLVLLRFWQFNWMICWAERQFSIAKCKSMSRRHFWDITKMAFDTFKAEQQVVSITSMLTMAVRSVCFKSRENVTFAYVRSVSRFRTWTKVIASSWKMIATFTCMSDRAQNALRNWRRSVRPIKLEIRITMDEHKFTFWVIRSRKKSPFRRRKLIE